MQINLTKPLLLLVALLLATGFLFAKSYQPQDFAESETMRLQAEADVTHAENMYALEEAARANANANTAVRRQYWTLTAGGVALSLFVACLFTAGAYAAYAVTWSLRQGLVQLAEARQGYIQVMHRPAFYELGDGRKIFETRGKRLLLLDETGAVTLLEGSAAVANPELVQVVMARIAAQVAIEQGKQRGKVEVIEHG